MTQWNKLKQTHSHTHKHARAHNQSTTQGFSLVPVDMSSGGGDQQSQNHLRLLTQHRDNNNIDNDKSRLFAAGIYK